MNAKIKQVLDAHFAELLSEMAAKAHADLNRRGYPADDRTVEVTYCDPSKDNPLCRALQVTVKHISGGEYGVYQSHLSIPSSLYSTEPHETYATLTRNQNAISAIEEAIHEEWMEKVFKAMDTGELYTRDASGKFCKL